MSPAGHGERRFAVVTVIASLIVFAALVPFARVPLPAAPVFIACFQSALFIADLITATLLFGQFTVTRAPALLVLGCAYLYLSLMPVVHALTFPGLFSQTGLLGAGMQTTAWLYMFWHAGFPLAVIAYAMLERPSIGHVRIAPISAIAIGAICVLASVAALTALTTAGQDYLPDIMRGNHYTPLMIFVVGGVWLLCLAPIPVLWRRRPHSVLDLWLTVAMFALLCDIALSAVLNGGRFDLGFYAGRVYRLLAVSALLIALLYETVRLYARVAQSFATERLEREGKLKEISSELIHLSRLSELGQMVSALAHEVQQPLTATLNYVHAGTRFLQSGQTDKTKDALAKAAGSVMRAAETVTRLRNFIRRDESERQIENLNAAVEEAVVLALATADDVGIKADLKLDPAGPRTVIDKIQIQQVLLNLVRNAVEAMADTPAPRLVVETAVSPDEQIEVSVTDNGPGLSPEVRDKLFQPFVTTKPGGMGVGLSVCRLIVEAHGGRLWAEDDSGGGAVFRFTVPSARAALHGAG